MVPEVLLTKTVTVQDAQALGYCVRGMRRGWNSFPEKTINGITFDEFIHKGVSLQWLLSLDHPYATTLANRIIELAKEEASCGQ